LRRASPYRSDAHAIREAILERKSLRMTERCEIGPLPRQFAPVPHLIIVVPCYDEETRLDLAAFRAFRLDGYRLEFCFVNDGSRDDTLGVLQRLHGESPERFTYVDQQPNAGKAEAVRRGVLAAAASNPDFIGFWDADLATPLRELPSFMEVFAARPEIAMVFAARVRLLGRQISRQTTRHYFGRVGATLISSSLGLAVYDTQCGAKLFRMSPELVEVFSRPFLSRWIFDVEIIARFVRMWGRDRASRSIYELPIQAWHDVKGSKVKSHDFLRALRDLWKIHRAYNLRGTAPAAPAAVLPAPDGGAASPPAGSPRS
jgi:dolichyl-phosphate beta-glucosyltransferase